MCLAQGHNAVTPVRLKPVASRSRVKHSTTEPLRSPYLYKYKGKLRPVPPSPDTNNKCRTITGSELQAKAEHARIQRGDRGSWKITISIGSQRKLAFGRPPLPPVKKVGPPPHHPVKCWTPLKPWKIIVFQKINHQTPL